MSDNGPSYRPNLLPGLERSAPESRRKDVEELRLAVRKLVLVALAHMPERDIEAAAGAACTVARAENLPIERVLILIHMEWASSDNSGGLRRETNEAVRARLASHCIRRFYEGH